MKGTNDESSIPATLHETTRDFMNTSGESGGKREVRGFGSILRFLLEPSPAATFLASHYFANLISQKQKHWRLQQQCYKSCPDHQPTTKKVLVAQNLMKQGETNPRRRSAPETLAAGSRNLGLKLHRPSRQRTTRRIGATYMLVKKKLWTTQ